MPHYSTKSKTSLTPDFLSNWLTADSTIVVGFSGGSDSVCLLHLLKQQEEIYNLKIIAAHLNHGWRAESDADELWCKNFCLQQNITYVSQKAADLNLTIKYNGSKEEVGRKLRRYFFQSVAQKYQAKTIMLAHHQDDQIETFFIRLLRGSSITGLTGMKANDGLYVRPLLQVTKQQILLYLQNHAIEHVTDASNNSNLFLRNRIRHTLPTAFNQVDQRWSQKIPQLMAHLQETDAFLEMYAHEQRDRISAQDKTKIVIESFLQLHSIVQHKILMQLLLENQLTTQPSQRLLTEILRFLQKGKKSSHTINNVIIVKEKKYFYCK